MKTATLLVLLFVIRVAVGQPLYFPPLTGSQWETVSPASLGWCTSEIDSLYRYLEGRNTKAFIVLKDGRIALERYFGTFSRDSNWYWASAGKTLTAFLVGVAQQERLLSLADSTSRYLGPGWTSSPPVKERLITIRHQLTMTTGLNDAVADPYCTLPSCLLYLRDAGTRWAYHNAPYTLIDRVVEAASGMTYNQYFLSRVRNRTGMNGAWLPSGYNNVYFSTARSMARYGLLLLNHGTWNADTLMRDTAYFRQMTNSSQQYNLSYGYLTWLNGRASYMLPQLQLVFPGSWAPDAPADMFAALGKNGQILNVIPSQRLVVVRMGDAPDTASNEITPLFNNDIWQRLNRVICNQTAVAQGNPPTAGFSLLQNYPNPFNPETTIEYSISKPAHVTLSVRDLLGRTIRVLVNEQQKAGLFRVSFHGSGLASGVYTYTLTAGGISATKLMVIVK